MAKTKKTPYRKGKKDNAVRPSTSKETEGMKKVEKKGEHTQWHSFLSDFNMQYIPI